MDNKFTVPKMLDHPKTVIFMTLDELFLFIVPALLGLFFNFFILGACMGFFCVLGLKRLKGDQGKSFLMHLLYWYFPQIVKLKKLPPSHLREFVG